MRVRKLALKNAFNGRAGIIVANLVDDVVIRSNYLHDNDVGIRISYGAGRTVTERNRLRNCRIGIQIQKVKDKAVIGKNEFHDCTKDLEISDKVKDMVVFIR